MQPEIKGVKVPSRSLVVIFVGCERHQVVVSKIGWQVFVPKLGVEFDKKLA